MVDADTLFPPLEASEFLTKRFAPVSDKTLAKYRVVGGGPEFHKFGRRILYSESALDAWGNSRLSPPLRTTTKQTKGKRRGRPKRADAAILAG